MTFIATLFVLLTAWPTCPQDQGDDRRPFAIEVVDEATGRGVPLIELTTVHNVRLVTDSAGIAAFDEPGLMGGRSVFFLVKGPGYEFPADGFGYRGKALDVKAGGSATLKVHRKNVAERLYRLTGGGIYRDSLLVGRPVPIREPVLNAQVLGSDSVVNAILGGKLLWFWGDTNRPAYPLGNFHVPGATSELPGQGGLDPSVGVDLTYRIDPKTGFAAETAHLPGDGPTWIGGAVVIPDRDGRETLFVHYVKIKPPMETYERGLARFDPESGKFTRDTVFPLNGPVQLGVGPAIIQKFGGKPYVAYAAPSPVLRVPVDADAIRDPGRYEAFTCLKIGTKPEEGQIDRAEDGSVRYAWKAGGFPIGPMDEAKLLRSGVLKPGEGLHNLTDVETGNPVTAHGGSVHWNDHRKRWVTIYTQAFGGPSFLGEIWLAEADTPLGPWAYTRKVASHEKYSFYNPKQHPYFDQQDGRLIYFEGTYTTTFSGNTDPTPRYDYNQLMYRIDLDDPRLNLPVAIYDLGDGRYRPRSPGRPVAWFALERPGERTLPVYEDGGKLVSGNPPDGRQPLFHALPADLAEPPPATALLFEEGGSYVLETDRPPGEGRRGPIARVWKNPGRVILPADGSKQPPAN